MNTASTESNFLTELHYLDTPNGRFYLESARSPNGLSEHPLERQITQLETHALGYYAIEYGAYLNVFDEQQQWVGGLQLQRRWQMCKLYALWLDDAYRGLGLGKWMLAEAQTLATLMGATHIMLETSTLHHYAFYLEQGFEVMSEFDDVIPDHRFFIMKKQLP